MAKPAFEFMNTELIPWTPIVEGRSYEKILSKDPETGSYTRLLMSLPDLDASIRDLENPPGKVLFHDDFHEEVFVLQGTLLDPKINKTYKAGYYACRPPKIPHGPFFHPTGAISFEVGILNKVLQK